MHPVVIIWEGFNLTTAVNKAANFQLFDVSLSNPVTLQNNQKQSCYQSSYQSYNWEWQGEIYQGAM